MTYIHRIQVYFGDTDGAGIVYYPNFYRWMDQSTHELFKSQGMPLTKLKNEQSIIVPLVEAKCNFNRPLFHDDDVEIHSKVIEIRNKILKIEHRFIRDDIEVAKGYEVRVWTSEENGKLAGVPVPDEIAQLLQNT